MLRQQPWCTYALHIATFTSLAFVTDPLIIYSCWWATEGLPAEYRYFLVGLELAWMFVFTKVVKLVGLFRKNPSDILFLPVSIVFGWFHGWIKLYALFTLKMVSPLPQRRIPVEAAKVDSFSLTAYASRLRGAAEPMVMSITTSVSRSGRSAARA